MLHGQKVVEPELKVKSLTCFLGGWMNGTSGPDCFLDAVELEQVPILRLRTFCHFKV